MNDYADKIALSVVMARGTAAEVGDQRLREMLALAAREGYALALGQVTK